MTQLKRLSDIAASDAKVVGGKAYHCAELRRDGLPVPDGFVVLPGDLGSAFLEEFRHCLNSIDGGTGFAVRSSATDEDSRTVSFAGVYETALNVEAAGVLNAIQACRASAKSPPVEAYRRTMKIPSPQTPPSVLVQRMISSRSSGVAFTLDPVTGDSTVIVVASAWGSGEAVVGGYVQADQFHISKALKPVSQAVGDKRYRIRHRDGKRQFIENDPQIRRSPSLTEKQLQELGRLVLQVERHFGSPQDIEWCFDGASFWIVQSRPITVRPKREDIQWTRANIREVLPDVAAPQVVAYLCQTLTEGYRKHYGRLFAPETELGAPVKPFLGRIYFNLSQFRHVCAVTGTPPAQVLRAIGHADGVGEEDEKVPPRPLGSSFKLLLEKLRHLWFQFTAARRLERDIQGMRKRVDALAQSNVDKIPDSDIVAALQSEQDQFAARMHTILILGEVGLYERRLQKLCEEVGFPYDPLFFSWLASGEKSVSAQQAFELLELARQARTDPIATRYLLHNQDEFRSYRTALTGTPFLRLFDAFLQQYGHRALKETDWSQPRFIEDPTPLLQTIRSHLRAPAVVGATEMASRQDLEWTKISIAFERQVKSKSGDRRVRVARWLLRRIKKMYLWRERYRSELMRVVYAKRRHHLALANRFVSRGWILAHKDYFLLSLEEISAAIRNRAAATQLAEIAERRRSELPAWRALEMPLLLRESELKTFEQAAAPKATPTLQGLCISPGVVEGEVKVLTDADATLPIPRGAILVAEAADPSWTPILTLAGGIIVEIGGTLSHAATVAREFGLPVVANVNGATRILRTGNRVRLDATSGLIHLL